jgi:hypothetical protein
MTFHLLVLSIFLPWIVSGLHVCKCFCYRYGNGAAIFTASGAAARKFQTEIEAGQVKIIKQHETTIREYLGATTA